MGSWLFKPLPRDMETKHKTKIDQQTVIKNNKEIKTMDQYPSNGQMGDPRNRQMGDTDP